MTAPELYQSGRLDEALAAAQQTVKSRPADVSARSFFCEMLCFAGELPRADQQLDAIGNLDSGAMLGVSLFRQLIRAETCRRQFFEEGRPPEVVVEPTEEIQLRLKASVCLRENDEAAAVEALAQAEQLRSTVIGTCDGESFTGIRDLDDLLGSVLEILTSNGKYYWVPWERVVSFEAQPIRHARDTLWRPVHILVREGPEGEVYLPVLYPGSFQSADQKNRLGRATDWSESAGGIVRGCGQKMLLIGEEARPLLQVGTIEIQG